jgi:predicted membrane-bound spermidine synthase
MNRMLPRRNQWDLAKLEFVLAVYAAVLPAALVGLGWMGGAVRWSAAAETAIPLLALLVAVIVGLEFPLAAKVDFRAVTSTAAKLYTADYVGAALGALLVSTFLIPLVGVAAVCWLAAGLNVVSGAVILVSGRGER